jgi:PAB-dependent poly(A)-specific ribonuclease subunit 3
MDDKLNTKAAEWRPQMSTKAVEWTPSSDLDSSTAHSDLRASRVKEFVPGQDWTAVANNKTSDMTSKDAPYPGSASPVSVPSGPAPAPSFRALHSVGLSEDMWRHYRDLSLQSMRQMDPSDPRHKAVPLPYCNAYCLDTVTTGRSSFGYPSSTFQVTSREDGNLYCLRRFDQVKSVNARISQNITERWSAIDQHPHIVTLYQCFVLQRAVFFLHAYIPGARTMSEVMSNTMSEPVLWSCATQLVSALRFLHAHGLAARTLDLQHILTTMTQNRMRLYLNCCGIADALEFEARKQVSELQPNDVRALGRVFLSLSVGTDLCQTTDAHTLQQCVSYCAQQYSREWHGFVLTLLQSTVPSVEVVSRAIANRVLEEQDTVYRGMDEMESLLRREYDASRAMRLLLKLGFIVERPENGPNRRWAESGDCYLLNLFRDYCFHQADGAGHAVMDLGHVITALNKLDAASEEQLVLTSRDGKTCLVVSFADVARCLESAFAELCVGSVHPLHVQY